jgi:hypothetical protein
MNEAEGMYAIQPEESSPTEILDHLIREGKHAATTNIRGGLAHELVN